MTSTDSPVRLHAVDAPGLPDVTPALEELYRGFESELLVPLWTEIGDLMPAHPRSRAVPHLWKWENLVRLAEQAGEIVPVGRGGERRAIALANPSLGGRPFATPTLWAAIQYLMPGEDAPEHRSQVVLSRDPPVQQVRDARGEEERRRRHELAFEDKVADGGARRDARERERIRDRIDVFSALLLCCCRWWWW